ncbi:uncharacterized protein LOC131901283 [Peromyscus eremicus]|uniref:uncharacterized protein LOC131901283 n=1 Tax=Peromyscus eremicus TaxID=42410 RepID=UPI0027DD1B93|nr:uncharacterized protein LOC131901283 [Peromyscus eremicus]
MFLLLMCPCLHLRALAGLPVEARLWISLTPVFPVLDDVGQHPPERTSPWRPRFWKEALLLSYLKVRPSNHGTRVSGPQLGALTSAHSCLPFSLVSRSILLPASMLPVLGQLESLERTQSCMCLGPATGTWTPCLLRRGCGSPRPPVVPASGDMGQHPPEFTSPWRPRFWKEALLFSYLNIRSSEHGTRDSGPRPWSLDQCTQLSALLPCVHPGAAFCQVGLPCLT